MSAQQTKREIKLSQSIDTCEVIEPKLKSEEPNTAVCCGHAVELAMSEAKLRSVQEELRCLKQENQFMLEGLAAKNTNLKMLVEQKSQILE